MVGTVYGDAGYYIAITESITVAGAGGITTIPDTSVKNCCWLFAESYVISGNNKDKFKEMGNDNSYNNRMGKFAREVELKNCVIYDDDGNATTNTQSLAVKRSWLESLGDIGGAAVYLIIKSLIDAVNVPLSRVGATPQYYMKGVPVKFRTVPEGNVYMLDITFKETKLY